MNEEIAVIEQSSIIPVQTAGELIIQSNGDLESAKGILDALKALQKKVHEVYDPMVESAYSAHKTATTERKKHLEPLEKAEKEVRAKMGSYLTALEREQKRVEAERQRIEQEAQAKAVQQQPLPPSPPPFGGGPKKFSAEPPAPKLTVKDLPPIPKSPQIEGMSQVKEWKWKIVDLAAIPPEFWILDERAIESTVKADKENTNIPGIEVFYAIRSRIS